MKAISRRKFFTSSLKTAAAIGAAPLALEQTGAALPARAAGQATNPQSYLDAIEKAIAFQKTMMDAYVSGSKGRLIQSYSDQSGLLSTSFTYDNAVSIHAFLLHGTRDSLARAEALGQGLVYAQAANFPFNAGRFAQAYFVAQPSGTGEYITPAAFPFYFYTSAVGDQSWAGMALAQLYRRTGNAIYLNAAIKVGNWIVANTYNTLGPGGYSFG